MISTALFHLVFDIENSIHLMEITQLSLWIEICLDCFHSTCIYRYALHRRKKPITLFYLLRYDKCSLRSINSGMIFAKMKITLTTPFNRYLYPCFTNISWDIKDQIYSIKSSLGSKFGLKTTSESPASVLNVILV